MTDHVDCPYAALVHDTAVHCDKEADHKTFHTAHVRGVILTKNGEADVHHGEMLLVWSDQR